MNFTPCNQTYLSSLEDLRSIISHDDIQNFFDQIAKLYGLQHIAYFAVNLPGTSINQPYLAVTYSHEWVEHYKTQHFLEIDPAIRSGFTEMLPFDWGQFSLENAELKRFFGEASEFGIGQRGLTVPLRGRLGERALFSITCDMSVAEWGRIRLLYMRDFQILAMHFHETVLQLQHPSHKAMMLSGREIECLVWTAEGKSAEDCAIILNISHRTVRAYLENARKKLNVLTTTQAVAKALKNNLLTPQL